MNDTYRIALLPGDGIGPDVTAEAVKVLRALDTDGNFFEFSELSVGAGEYLRSGDPLPEATFEQLEGLRRDPARRDGIAGCALGRRHGDDAPDRSS